VSAGSGHGERQEEIFAFRRKNAEAKRLYATWRNFLSPESERHSFGKQFLPCFLKMFSLENLVA
jgi:hypothetical protein